MLDQLYTNRPIDQTIDQFLCYLTLTKFWKDVRITDLQLSRKKRNHIFTLI